MGRRSQLAHTAVCSRAVSRAARAEARGMSSHWPYHRPPVKERLKKSLLIALTKRAIHHDSPVTRPPWHHPNVSAGTASTGGAVATGGASIFFHSSKTNWVAIKKMPLRYFGGGGVPGRRAAPAGGPLPRLPSSCRNTRHGTWTPRARTIPKYAKKKPYFMQNNSSTVQTRHTAGVQAATNQAFPPSVHWPWPCARLRTRETEPRAGL
jgi:hypothetical protein